jgi:hypothetical protein
MIALPDRMWLIEGGFIESICTWPPIRSASIGPALWGRGPGHMVIIFNSSALMAATAWLVGRDSARLPCELQPAEGLTEIRIHGDDVRCSRLVTGTKSFAGRRQRLAWPN